jgi:hypothetical protein
VAADRLLRHHKRTVMANAKQTPVQAQQAQATAAINGSKSTKDAAAPKPAAPATAKPKRTIAKWSTVTVTAATPAYSPNRATSMDIEYGAARINDIADLKLDGKADKTYVRRGDGVVRSARSPLAVEALAAHTQA